MKGQPKVDLMTRFIAALIDGGMSSVVGFIPVVGAILGAAYMLVKDGLFEGQSVGKKIMKLQVISESGEKADYIVSAKRNLIFAIPIAIMIIPVLGWFLAPVLALVIFVIEVIKIINDPNGRRLGDTFAETQVVMFEQAMEKTVDSNIVPPIVPPDVAEEE